jgi:hypothetical protein
MSQPSVGSFFDDEETTAENEHRNGTIRFSGIYLFCITLLPEMLVERGAAA